MGVAFDHWLAKPSTLCFLRRMIAPHTGPTRRVRNHGRSIWTGDRRYGAATAVREEEELGEDQDCPHVKLSDIQARRDSLQANEMAIKMSFMAGVSILADEEHGGTFAKLRYQSDVNNDDLIGQLIVDSPAQAENYNLWIEIVRFRHRIDGFDGVYDVWKGMRRRAIDLPVEGPAADELWRNFIKAGICRKNQETDARAQMRNDVLEYARELHTRKQVFWNGIYSTFVGHWLRVRPKMAIYMDKQFRDCGLVHPGALANVLPAALRSEAAFKVFAQIYGYSEDRDLYDPCIDEELRFHDKQMDKRMALRLHKLFLSHGDGPTSTMFARPDVQQLFDLDKGASLPMRWAKKRDALNKQTDVSPMSTKKLPSMTRAGMNIIVGDVYGIKPKGVSDSFCAKLLATKAFSIEVIISGLSFFGIQTLGPLATRELIVRACNPVEFSNILADLKFRGIQLDDTIFSRLVKKVTASENSSMLWSALLESDQHPDTYGDADLQERLLSLHLDERQWPKAHVALLTLSLSGTTQHYRGWNRVLQHYIARREYRSMLGTMQSIRDQKMPLTLDTIRYLFDLVLPRRQRSKNYAKGSSSNLFDSLRFCVNAFVYGAEQGGYVSVYKWTELLKRLGMDNRWDELKRLTLWMSHWYFEGGQAVQHKALCDFPTSPGEQLRKSSADKVFVPKMIGAIFTWGFRHASHHRKLYAGARETGDREGGQHERWASGLALLKTLRDRGLPVDEDDVRASFILRMWILFGPAWSNRAVNNEARRHNQLSLAHYVRHCKDVWPGLLDYIGPKLLEDTTESNERLLVALFGGARRTRKKTDEYANVGAWAAALSRYGKDHIHESSKRAVKQRNWESSPFRMKLITPISKDGNLMAADQNPIATVGHDDGDAQAQSHASPSENTGASMSTVNEDRIQSSDNRQSYRPFS